MDIQKLRQETEADHRAVEGAMLLMHEGFSTAQYIQCLRQIYGVVAAWEERAAEVAPLWLRPALFARQRKPLFGNRQAGEGYLKVTRHSNRGIQGVFVLKSRTEWMGADAT